MIRLSDLTRAEGYELVIAREPWTHRVLGDPKDPQCFNALVCAGDHGPYVACKADLFDHVYAVSHEIAEHQRGFGHTAETFEHQSIVLARWVRQLAREIR